jgi:threonine dehydrogenase-like Zn-dependent dehydrogenase
VSGKVQNGKFKGKDVVLNPLITCGKCEYCISGKEHLCHNRIILGMNKPIERQGVFAEFVSTPDQNIYEIPDGLDKNEAPVAEPTAVSLHAVLIGEQSLKKPLSECRILVQGGGAIGLLCGLILSKIKGSKDIVLSDPNEFRLAECAKYLDAKFVSPNNKEIDSNSFDIVFDTVGLEISRQQAIEVAKPGGSIIHIGLSQPAGSFNFRKMTLQEVTIIGTYCYTSKDFEQTLKILANKEIGSLDWIEFRDLKSGVEAFKQIHDGTCVAPKIILLP